MVANYEYIISGFLFGVIVSVDLVALIRVAIAIRRAK